MAIYDLTSDFLSYVQQTHISYNSSWSASNFLKLAQSSLQQLSNLQTKVADLKRIVKTSSRFDKEKNTKMILNIKETIKTQQQSIKRLATFQLDIKGNYHTAQQFRNSLLTALEMRLLKATFSFKQAYQQNTLKGKSSTRKLAPNQQNDNSKDINLNRSHFLSQSHQQLIEQASIKQYKQIEKSINEIFDMYRDSLNAVKMHDYLIDSIQNNVHDIDENVKKGKDNLSQVHRRQSKNRSLIIKMFVTLYVITFVYIVFLS